MSSVPAPYSEFQVLYDAVTRKLWDFALEAQIKGRMSSADLAWFYDVIVGFTHEFRQWSSAPPGPIWDYLACLEQRKVSPTFRVAGHAFLHVAYDLPRVIADNLAGRTQADRMRLRSVFLRPAPVFRELFMEQVRQGLMGFFSRPLGYLKPAEILSYWLLTLRTVAWIHAETLVDAASGRSTLERQLAQGLFNAAQASLQVKGLARVPKLDNSTLLQVASPVAFVSTHPLLISSIAMAVALATIAGSAASLHNQVRANRTAYFGALVLIETSKALQGTQEAPPPAREMVASV
ncbi:MAG: hypothetical protein ABW034_15600 [Steroidobacteraceae bacterium]